MYKMIILKWQNGISRTRASARKIKQLEQYFNAENLPIIYVQHINPPQASFFQENTDGVLLHPELSAGSNSLIVTKHYPNSF